MQTKLLFFSLVVVSASAFAATAPSDFCEGRLAKKRAILKPLARTLPQGASNFEKDIFNLDKALDKLDVNSDGLKVIESLGGGAQSVVIKVQHLNHTLALKLYFQDETANLDESVIIQKHLGQLGIAPRIYGLLRSVELEDFVQSIDAKKFGISEPIVLGVLMELSAFNFLKDNSSGMFEKTPVTAAQKEVLRAEAAQHLNALRELNITPMDVDGVVDFDGHLKLVDFGYYKYQPFINDRLKAQKQQAAYEAALTKLLGFIEDGTSVRD